MKRNGRVAHFLYLPMHCVNIERRFVSRIASTLSHQLSSIVTAMGYEFVGAHMQGGVLRLFIDKEKGVGLTDCSYVSRQVSAMLDVEDPIQGRYVLEVSSPGLDRPLFEITHYEKQLGLRIKVQMQAPINHRRKFAGVLLRIVDNDIHLLVDEEEVVLPFSEIEKANVIADIR
jgi:ribosome maturation factor RimP